MSLIDQFKSNGKTRAQLRQQYEPEMIEPVEAVLNKGTSSVLKDIRSAGTPIAACMVRMLYASVASTDPE